MRRIEESESETVSGWLMCTKMAAVVLSFLYASPHLPFVGALELNFVSATLLIAFVGLVPRFGWTIPMLVLGFWVTPMLIAFRVDGSFAEDLTACIAGGVLGLLFGIAIDLKLFEPLQIEHDSTA